VICLYSFKILANLLFLLKIQGQNPGNLGTESPGTSYAITDEQTIIPFSDFVVTCSHELPHTKRTDTITRSKVNMSRTQEMPSCIVNGQPRETRWVC